MATHYSAKSAATGNPGSGATFYSADSAAEPSTQLVVPARASASGKYLQEWISPPISPSFPPPIQLLDDGASNYAYSGLSGADGPLTVEDGVALNDPVGVPYLWNVDRGVAQGTLVLDANGGPPAKERNGGICYTNISSRWAQVPPVVTAVGTYVLELEWDGSATTQRPIDRVGSSGGGWLVSLTNASGGRINAQLRDAADLGVFGVNCNGLPINVPVLFVLSINFPTSMTGRIVRLSDGVILATDTDTTFGGGSVWVPATDICIGSDEGSFRYVQDSTPLILECHDGVALDATQASALATDRTGGGTRTDRWVIRTGVVDEARPERLIFVSSAGVGDVTYKAL